MSDESTAKSLIPSPEAAAQAAVRSLPSVLGSATLTVYSVFQWLSVPTSLLSQLAELESVNAFWRSVYENLSAIRLQLDVVSAVASAAFGAWRFITSGPRELIASWFPDFPLPQLVVDLAAIALICLPSILRVQWSTMRSNALRAEEAFELQNAKLVFQQRGAMMENTQSGLFRRVAYVFDLLIEGHDRPDLQLLAGIEKLREWFKQFESKVPWGKATEESIETLGREFNLRRRLPQPMGRSIVLKRPERRLEDEIDVHFQRAEEAERRWLHVQKELNSAKRFLFFALGLSVGAALFTVVDLAYLGG
jgi:hypothetical protein